MRYGSLINQLSDGAASITAEVGMGGTVLFWSDRQAVTVTFVSKTGHRVLTQDDTAVRTDGNGMSDAQTYRYERNLHGSEREFTRRKDGTYRAKGGTARLVLGRRDHYHDYSF